MIRVRVEPWRASAALRQMGFAKRPLYLIWAVLLGGLLLFALFQVVFSPKTTAVLSAQLEEQQAIESDLSGNRQAAAASFLRCPTAQGFSDFSFSKRQELFRVAAARRLPEENDYFRALVLSHGLARWNKRSVAFYVSPELGESGKQLIERCLREWLDPVKDQVYFSLVGNENQAEIVCVPLLYSQQKGESVRGHTI